MIDISKFYRNKLTQGKCPESHRKRPRSHNKIKPATIKKNLQQRNKTLNECNYLS